MFMYMWEYHVKPEAVQEFEQIYGANGEWVQLFKKADGYIGTELHRSHGNNLRYISIDYWASQEARDRFRQNFTREFDHLDKQCEALTMREILIGNFDRISLATA